MRKILYGAVLLAAVAAVGQGCSKIDIKPTPIVNLYDPMLRFDSMDSASRHDFIVDDSVCIKALLKLYDISSVTDDELVRWSKSAPVRIFTPAVDSVYSDLSGLEISLGNILYNADANGLEFPRRKYAAVVWGSRKSMAFVDSVLLIALNHYLGADYPGYGPWPEYQRYEKNPENLPYDLAEALTAVAYPYVPGKDPTALSRMLYEGALMYAKMKLVPQATLAGALGYTEQQMNWFQANMKSVWRRIVENKLLYTSSAETIDRLIGPAPSTSPLGQEVPGRAGRYIGYRIICAYLEQNSKMTLAELLFPDFYNNPSVLIESAYSGE